jgi:hypothetical protein
MWYIILGLAGLLILVALFTYLSRRKHNEPEEVVAPPADCCGAHAVCEKGLKKADPSIEYFEDEDLDRFKHIPADAYTADQIDIFREVLYTLRPEEITDWLISLEKREIALPYILRQEAIDMCP